MQKLAWLWPKNYVDVFLALLTSKPLHWHHKQEKIRNKHDSHSVVTKDWRDIELSVDQKAQCIPMRPGYRLLVVTSQSAISINGQSKFTQNAGPLALSCALMSSSEAGSAQSSPSPIPVIDIQIWLGVYMAYRFWPTMAIEAIPYFNCYQADLITGTTIQD